MNIKLNGEAETFEGLYCMPADRQEALMNIILKYVSDYEGGFSASAFVAAGVELFTECKDAQEVAYASAVLHATQSKLAEMPINPKAIIEEIGQSLKVVKAGLEAVGLGAGKVMVGVMTIDSKTGHVVLKTQQAEEEE